MSNKYKKTHNSKWESGHSASPRDRHNVSSRPGLLFRLGCAVLAMTVAVCAAPLLRRFFEAQLPMVHAAGQTINVYGTWDSNDKMEPGQTSLDVDKIYMNAGSVIRIRNGKTINMVNQQTIGSADLSVIYLYSNANLHLYGTMTGSCDELNITSDSSHVYVYLNEGAVFDVTFNDDTFGSRQCYIECIGYNVGSNLTDSETYPDVNFDISTDIQVLNVSADPNVAVIQGESVGKFCNVEDTTYRYTASPVEGFSRLIWLKGGANGFILNPETQTQFQNTTQIKNRVDFSCKENAKGQLYAKYIPDDAWTWDLEEGKATYTVTNIDPAVAGGTTEVTYTDDTLESVVNEETGNTIYTASVTVDGEPITGTYEVDNDNQGTGEGGTGEGGTGEGGTGEGGTGEGGTNGDHSKDYAFITGSVWSWTKGTAAGMPVILKNTVGDDTTTFSKLQKVFVDGTLLTQDVHYKAVPGSIKITLQPSYLKNLSAGTHTLTVELKDATLEHTFTIAESGGSDPGKGSDSPKTGESNFKLFLSAWLFMASSAMIVMLLFQKKKKNTPTGRRSQF